MRARDSLWKTAALLLHGAIAVVALSSLTFPVAAQDKVWRVGLLSGGSQEAEAGMQSTWRGGLLLSLDRSGFHVGNNMELVVRHAAGDLNR